MQWFQLIAALLPIAEEVFAAIQQVIASGKTPAQVQGALVDHLTATPAAIRAA